MLFEIILPVLPRFFVTFYVLETTSWVLPV